MRKIGLMGGTFNPIHNAHLQLAKTAMEEYGLEEILFMTSGNPPHKREEAVLDKTVRHQMVKLAVAPYSGFVPCDDEVRREAYSYTADTLQRLQKARPDASIYFIIGADSLHQFKDWYMPEKIVKLCTLLVFPRAGYDLQRDMEAVKARYRAEVLELHAGQVDISSTQLRECIAEGRNISAYVPEVVYAFIKNYKLYQRREGTMEEQLAGMLSPKRFRHSLGVRDTAVELARRFGADEERAEIAGLLHDCAKNLPVEEQLAMCRDLGVELDRWELENPGALAHAKLGAELVKCLFDVSDEAVSSAIRWHTLGRAGMSDLEKIIFAADMVEPNRKYPEAEALRKAVYADLDRGVLACVDATIAWNEQKGAAVHPNAYALRDWLKNKI